MNPTKEQLAIVQAVVNGESVRVDAVSGSGKTTSSVMMAEAVKKPVLYLAYNKLLAKEGVSKFGKSAVVRTTHSLAYRALDVGKNFGSKLHSARDRNPEYGVTYSDIVKVYSPEYVGSFYDRYDVAKLAIAAIKRFQYSSDLELNESHCRSKENSNSVCLAKVRSQCMPDPDEMPNEYEARLKKISKEVVGNTIDPVLKLARKMWSDKINPTSKFKMDHDTYLKMFQLSLSGVSGSWKDLSGKKSGYGMVILDEAQDTNACVLDIVRRMDTQTAAVGDRRQAIYGWRGAENAMEKLEYKALRLSQSWRFGPKVAELATSILQHDNYEWEIYGNPGRDTVIGDISDSEPKTFLSRSNAGVISKAIEYIERGEKVCIEIDAARIGRMVIDCVEIKNGWSQRVKTPDLKPYAKEWDVLEEISKDDIDLKKVVKIANGNEDEARRIGGILSDYKKPKDAQYSFCTAHKSKGLEWDNVVLCDDFPVPSDEGDRDDDDDSKDMSTEDYNLLYVAATRPMKRLEVNDAAGFFVEGYTKAKDRVENG